MAQLSITLVKYTSTEYIKKFLIYLLGFFIILFIARLLETLRVTATKDISFIMVAKIAFNRSPYLLQRIAPLICLFSTMSTVTTLNKRNELIVIKGSGVSIWQFMLPIALISFIIGAIFLTILNPIASAMFNISQNYEKKHFAKFSNSVTLTLSNIWLKEESHHHKRILRAKYISKNGKTLESISIHTFDKEMNFVSRIDAEKANILDSNTIEFENGYKFEEGKLPIAFDKYTINMHISPEGLQEGFSSPGTISFWDLPQFIKLFKKAGFSAIKYHVYFVSILFLPIQMVIYSVIGVLSSLSLMRSNKFYLKVILGIICGLVYFFINEMITALSLGSNTSIYFTLAIPLIIGTLVLIYMLLHLEES